LAVYLHVVVGYSPFKLYCVIIYYCDRCGLKISFTAINGQHYETAFCKDGVTRKVQYAAAERAHTALQQTFTAYGAELERVEVFKYLGRLLAYGEGESQKGVGRLGKALPLDQGRKCIPPCVRHILQSKRAINTTVWKRDMELVTAEFEVFGRVSYKGHLAYGRQEAIKAFGWYLDVPKLSGCS
jgi:hypothetical protein